MTNTEENFKRFAEWNKQIYEYKVEKMCSMETTSILHKTLNEFMNI